MEEAGAQNAGLGNITVFLAHGRFLGDTLFADTEDGRPRGEVGLNCIRDRTRPRDGGVPTSAPGVPRWLCFSLARRARSGVCSAAVTFLQVLATGLGVLGGSATATMSRANWLAWTISSDVSPRSIAGNDIRFHCSLPPTNLPLGDLLFAGVPLILPRHAHTACQRNPSTDRTGRRDRERETCLTVSCLQRMLVRRYPRVLRGLRLTPETTLAPPATVYCSSWSRAMHRSICKYAAPIPPIKTSERLVQSFP